jgi:hypothetical protein
VALPSSSSSSSFPHHRLVDGGITRIKTYFDVGPGDGVVAHRPGMSWACVMCMIFFFGFVLFCFVLFFV